MSECWKTIESLSDKVFRRISSLVSAEWDPKWDGGGGFFRDTFTVIIVSIRKIKSSRDGGAAVGFLYGWRDCLDEIKIIRIILPSSIRINATERNIFFALQASDYSAFAVKLIWRWVFVRKYVFGGVWIRRAGVLNHYFGGSLVWLYDLNENVSLLHLSLQLRQVLTRNSNKI